MSDLDKALSELITKSIEGMEKAGDFIAGELPLFVSELLMIRGVSHFVILLFLIAGGFCVLKVRKRVCALNDMYGPDQALLSGALLFSIIPIAVISCYQTIKLLTVILAPRVYLFEYASKLVAS